MSLKDEYKDNKTTIVVSISASALTVLFLVIIGYAGGIIRFTAYQQSDTAVTRASEVGMQDSVIITGESRIVDIVERANPAVVSIIVTKDVPVYEQNFGQFDPFGGDFFDRFFGGGGFGAPVPQLRQNGTEKREVGGGSGFFISDDGYIVTNRHVVDDAEADYTVLTNDGATYEAEILAKDSTLDVAILRVRGSGFSYVSFGNSDLLKPGQTVIAIGNALAEFHNSVSVGVVSGLFRSITAGDPFGKSEYLEGVIQTDAAINPGNSGGPLLDIYGNVIGVNVAVSNGAQNIGFALPSNTVKSIADSVKEYGEIVRPYIGIRYAQITESIKEKNNLSVDYGVLVLRGDTPEELAVIPGSPADKAGIVENDIILEADGVKLEQGKSLASLIRQKQIGQTVQFLVLHKGAEKNVVVTLEKAPKDF